LDNLASRSHLCPLGLFQAGIADRKARAKPDSIKRLELQKMEKKPHDYGIVRRPMASQIAAGGLRWSRATK
jgi:hypothetical protein